MLDIPNGTGTVPISNSAHLDNMTLRHVSACLAHRALGIYRHLD